MSAVSDMRKKNFELEIQDLFYMSSSGLGITGKVLSGAVRVGDEVVLVKKDGKRLKTRVSQIEGYRKVYQEAVMGDNICLWFKNLNKDDFMAGEVVVFEWE